jgi:hypothetical protein
MKYRRLTLEELKNLEKEFIDFLVVNGIPAGDWEKIKTDESKAEGLIDSFSEVVFEKIMRQIEYVAHYSPHSIKMFHCQAESIHLIAIDTNAPDIDLTTDAGIKRLKTYPPSDIQIYQSAKKYSPDREQEIFKMLSQGCVKTDGTLYKLLTKSIE